MDGSIIDFLRAVPLHVGAMDVLRTGISALGHFDPQVDENTTDANIAMPSTPSMNIGQCGRT